MIDTKVNLQLGVGLINRLWKIELYNDSRRAWSCGSSSNDIGCGRITSVCSSETDKRLLRGACNGAVNQRGSTGNVASMNIDCQPMAWQQ